jgi:hypothetical protein
MDNDVQAIPATVIEDWAERGFNFAAPNHGVYFSAE